MHELLQQIFSGLAAGAIYASVALALVMIYRATDLVNFAQGEMAMFSTYIAWSLVTVGLPFWAAFLITLVASFLGGMAIERIIIRPVENAPVLAAVIVTIGLVLIFNSLAGWLYSYTVQDFPSPFPDRPLIRGPDHDAGAGRGRGDAGDAHPAVPVLPLHQDRAGDACRRAKSGIGAPLRHSGRTHAGDRLGPRRRDRRHGRHHGGAGACSSIPT